MVAFVSCSKNSDSPAPDPVVTRPDYQPGTKGSYWKYKDSATGDVYTQTVLDSTAVFDNITYKAIASSGPGGDTRLFYAKLASKYYLHTSFSIDDTNVPFTLNYLDDSVATGTSWTTTTNINYSGTAIPVQVKTTILEKNLTKTVNGKQYTNIIHSSVVASFNVLIVNGSITSDYYCAPGLGIIRTEIKSSGSLPGLPGAQVSELTEYKIQ
ncbi:hypothetical protein DXN05_03255 [Deminuibacter soli]|uniref:Uncharacterized protein n=2 Tax=Deminuibacter soli TaxID=2291815 RepID=A0A3E1NQ03_9BACT|nr:hypothetical protein DXN05_03255 [Deminuibacter soli]